jgi:hypothetical protein
MGKVGSIAKRDGPGVEPLQQFASALCERKGMAQ